jgi:hypothetical protein
MENELNKMTAVEWFIEQLEQKGDASENLYVRRVQISVDVSDYLDLKRQAKQMEKEQIMDAWEDGVRSDNGFFGTFEQYYKETYGGNK